LGGGNFYAAVLFYKLGSASGIIFRAKPAASFYRNTK
jgi:hypothetical protein